MGGPLLAVRPTTSEGSHILPTATKTKPTFVGFFAPCPNLRLIRVGEDEEIVGAHGKRKIKGFMYEFVNHVLRVREGEDVLEDANDPETGEPAFQDAVSWLRAEAAKRDPSQPDYFAEEIPPVPAPSIALGAIVQALSARDADWLTRILDEERETHNRPEIIDAAMGAFESLDEQEGEQYPPGPDGSPEGQEVAE